MRKTIDAVYEKGVIKPLEDLPFSESERIRVTVETRESIVTSTRALITAPAHVVEEIAESEEYQVYDS